MRSVTEVPIEDSRALNQAILAADGVPRRARLRPAALVRALRSALRMSQAQLARRSGVTKWHIACLESERHSPRLETLELLFDAMFCGLLVLPVARVRPREAIARRRSDDANARPRRWRYRIWDD